MEKTIEFLEKFDKLREGTLSGAEKIALEAQLASDEELKNLFEQSEIVNQIIIASEASKIKEQIKKDLSKPKFQAGWWAVGGIFLFSAIGIVAIVKHSNNTAKPLAISENTDSQNTTYTQIYEKNIDENVQHIKTEKPQIVDNQKSPSKPNETEPKKKEVEIIQESTISKDFVNDSNLKGKENFQTKLDSKEEVSLTSSSSKAITKPIDPCADFKGDVEFETVPSCKGKSTGEVIFNLNSVKSGKKPYVFTVNGLSSSSKITSLASNEYLLIVKDANGCSVESPKKVLIGEKNCVERKDFVFNLNYDAIWQLNANEALKASTLVISDANGRVVLRKTIEDNLIEWNGESNTGQQILSGNYFYVLTYQEGSITQGTITLVK
ncbi:MAG: gliding motility-associated C-terminal domain-containing protein [Cytophagales bacterium]